MSLFSKIKPKGPSGFGYGTTAEEVTQDINLSQRTILITGGNSGIGRRVGGRHGAMHADLAASSGKYFVDCNLKKPTNYVLDDDLARRLWTKTEEIVESFACSNP